MITEPAGPAERLVERAGVRPLTGRRAGVVRWLRERDVGVGYALVVLVVGLYVHTRPGRQSDLLVLDSSTNLANLRENPLAVLAVSAFVVSSLAGLWILPLLVLGYGAAQRWLGRTATVVVGVIGHVGATLLVATLLVVGVRHGRLDPSVTRAPDVGVSYGLLCLAGLLVPRVQRRWRLPYVLLLVAATVGGLTWHATFTDVGHLVSLLIGLGLAAVATGAERTLRRRPLLVSPYPEAAPPAPPAAASRARRAQEPAAGAPGRPTRRP